ncbi:MAG: paraquat-inducible protein A [Alphaproteobacteria bacterium]
MSEPPLRSTSVRHPGSLAATARGADRWLGLYFMAVSGLLVAGWTLPIMTVHKLVFFAEEVSILAGARQLWDNGNPFLCLVILAFSVAFPALKMLVALTLWYGADARGPDLAGLLGWLEAFGRWSMLDVFVVALTIVAIQISIVSDVTTHAGLYVFTAAVVLSMAGIRRLVMLARRAAAPCPPAANSTQ